jgi:uncharacterized tellurite resistance protein B-like protein
VASTGSKDSADRIAVITDLLLGAAYADSELRGDETAAVRALLEELLGEELPEAVDHRIDSFDPAKFDVAASANAFAADAAVSKRRLLELVAQVSEADGELALAEDDYLRKLAAALSLSADDIDDLVLDYEVEELRGALDELRGADRK